MNLIGNLKRRVRDCVRYLTNAVATLKEKRGDPIPTNTCSSTPSSSSGSTRRGKLRQRNNSQSFLDPEPPLSPAILRASSPSLSESDSEVEPYIEKVWRCICDDRQRYKIAPAAVGLDLENNARALDKFLALIGDASEIKTSETKDLGLDWWQVPLTKEQFHEVLLWPETSGCLDRDLCPVHDRPQLPEREDPTRKQYIVWGTDDCWYDHETASRGFEKLLAIAGCSSRVEAKYRTDRPSGIVYWRSELREDEIPKVQDMLEVLIMESFAETDF
ncbi:hypothetical protein CGCSCA5_v012524 [Colletotrichum siamense]|nr:hypothetical protein CGCSCA5_v012524 [Colletotrichum siamense]